MTATTLLGTNGPVEEIESKRRGMKIFCNKKISNSIAAGFLATTALVYLLCANYLVVDSKISLFAQHPNIQSHMDGKHFMEVLENVPEYEEDYPHDHLYDRNLTLVNLTNFKFLINNDICNVRRVSLVTIIHSASQNTEARAMIRWKLFILLKVSSDGIKTTS